MNENNINKIEKYKFLLRLDHSILREVLLEKEKGRIKIFTMR